MTFLQNYFFLNNMRKKIDYKKSQVQLKKKHFTKLVNQGNLGYSSKPTNHVNLIERFKKKQIIKSNSQPSQY